MLEYLNGIFKDIYLGSVWKYHTGKHFKVVEIRVDGTTYCTVEDIDGWRKELTAQHIAESAEFVLDGRMRAMSLRQYQSCYVIPEE